MGATKKNAEPLHAFFFCVRPCSNILSFCVCTAAGHGRFVKKMPVVARRSGGLGTKAHLRAKATAPGLRKPNATCTKHYNKKNGACFGAPRAACPGCAKIKKHHGFGAVVLLLWLMAAAAFYCHLTPSSFTSNTRIELAGMTTVLVRWSICACAP